MSLTYEFYAARASEAKAAADDATLDNVRDRHLGAHKAWTTLSDQVLRVTAARLEAEREKAHRMAIDAGIA